jgi:hypothetical protein
VRRGVVIRRIFVLEQGTLADDARVRKMRDQQRSAGITVRLLDASAMTPARVLLLPDLAIFDDEICYELTTVPHLGAAETPVFPQNLVSGTAPNGPKPNPALRRLLEAVPTI